MRCVAPPNTPLRSPTLIAEPDAPHDAPIVP
jgi:hypothetical protein